MIKYLTLIILTLPLVGLAIATEDVSSGGLFGLMVTFVELINWVVGLLIGLATLLFLWGVLTYVIHGDSESKKTEAKGYMVYGVITLFIMVAVWTIVYLLSNSFGLKTGIILPDKKSSVDTHIVLLDNR